MRNEHIEDLADFVVAAPSSYHAAAEAARRLRADGYLEQNETEPWDAAPGGHFVVRDGAVVAWRVPTDAPSTSAYRILGAHTDSPAFKLKPKPTTGAFGWLQAGVEVYGGPLLNSWLDRDLALAGRLVTRAGDAHLVHTGPLLRLPQLAIHLDRAVNDGLTLDKQRHTQPIWGLGDPTQADLLAYVAGLVDLDATDVAGYDVVTVDTQRPQVIGGAGEFLASARLDNLSSVHAGLTALLAATETPGLVPMVAAFDHEEIGSESRSGASGPLLADVIHRTSVALGAGPDELARAIATSVCLSADAGHAIHPNYPERHDPANRPLLNAGPLLKINANQRYATDAHGAAIWARACETVGAPYQEFVSNNAIACGSTIGPLTATRLGVRTVDVGIPLLSMHSARELCGVADPGYLAAAARAFFADPVR